MRAGRAVVFLLLVLLGGVTACDKPLTVEQRVIATIRDMEASIEAGERRAFMTHISEDFKGQQGVMNHDQVRAMVVFQLTRYKSLQAQLFPIRVIETGENSAKAFFRALVTGGPGWIPENGQVFDFETGWILTDGEWLLQSANWKPLALEGAL